MYDWRYAAENEPTYETLKRPRGNPYGRKRAYTKAVGAFDIETSTVYDTDGHPHSFMYIWMFAVDDRVYCGRSWDEFKDFLMILRRRIPKGTRMLTYIHNASFEYQYLSGQFDLALEDIFATDPRKILKLDLCEWLECRCSYFLTNMTLRKFLEKENVPVQKEELDYSKLRFPWTELSKEELSYCEADVLGLTQAIRSRAARSGDTWYTIPFTSTGYVRREAKRVLHTAKGHERYRYDSWEVYKRLMKAFRGGNTHASRYMAALGVLEGDIRSRDFSSHYPAQICGKLYPGKEFFVVPKGVIYEGGDSIAYMEGLINRGYAVLFTIRMTGVEVDEMQPVPYLSIDKCEICREGVLDNGRILEADELVTTVTDVDWKIIKSMYTYEDARITWLAYSTYEPLPQEYIDLTRDYYKRKTELKGVDPYSYDRVKELLNSLYGMMAQAVLRMEMKMDEHGILYEEFPEDMEGAYMKNAKKCFMPYSWGVWLTAWARYELQRAIDAVGVGNFIYCDTDSVKYLAEGCEVDFDKLFPGDDFVAYDPKGKPHRMGVMEEDAVYDQFVTLGAKKYAVRYADTKKIQITVAGVGKSEGSAELEAKGGLTAFRPGLIFKSGGIDAVYNDLDDFTYEVDDKHLEITRNVSLVEGEYTLGLANNYQLLLDALANGRRIIDPFDLD